MIEQRAVAYRFWFGDRVQSDRGEVGSVVGMSSAVARGGERLTHSYRLEVEDPVWYDRQLVWVPEVALSFADG